jgi:zinc transporter, ZIP family
VSGSSVFLVFLAALVTALATGLGALPFAFGRSYGERLVGLASGVAAGVMLGASASLVIQGWRDGHIRVVGGCLLGAVFVLVAHRVLAGREDAQLGGLSAADARKAVLVIAVMTVHSGAEGIGVGASFGGGDKLGLLIAAAIAIHNIPEGLAISLVLVPRGVSVRAAAGWSIFSSIPQPILAVPAFLFVESFKSVLPLGLGFAAGAMIWLASAELAPDAFAHAHRLTAAAAIAIAFASMLMLQTLFLNAV